MSFPKKSDYPRIHIEREPPPQFDTTDLGSPKKIWSVLCDKDEKYRRDPFIFQRQQKINAKMRSMLLDWLMDVCNDKALHRETYHLCIDYIDRYLCLVKTDVVPQRLQLIGATALFIASKIEEIYPPKVSDIADYTDGCCTDQDLREMEEIMLQQLEWNCYPITAVHWLALYMQLMSTNDVIRAEHVVMTAAPRRSTALLLNDQTPCSSFDESSNNIIGSPLSPTVNHMQSALKVSVLLDDCDDWMKKNTKKKKQKMGKAMEEREDGGTNQKANAEAENGDDNSENRKPAAELGANYSSVDSPKTNKSEHKRRITFNSSFPQMRVSHIGSSPVLTLHTASCDISYVGHHTYSSGHIYPDQRCTVPKLMRGEFVRLATILDLVTMHAGSLRFRYRELASAVLLCSFEPEALIYQLTGFRPEKIRVVREFVEPFVRLFDRLEPTGTRVPCVPDVPYSDRHNIQTYISENLLQLISDSNELKEAGLCCADADDYRDDSEPIQGPDEGVKRARWDYEDGHCERRKPDKKTNCVALHEQQMTTPQRKMGH